MTARPRVGFIGVGLMGHGMAKNMVEAGYPLTVLAHRNREPVEDLKSRGATEVDDVAALAAQPVGLCQHIHRMEGFDCASSGDFHLRTCPRYCMGRPGIFDAICTSRKKGLFTIPG